MREGIAGERAVASKDRVHGAELGFAAEVVGGTRAMAAMESLGITEDMHVFYLHQPKLYQRQ